MSDMPPLAICLLTADRTELALRTVRALELQLKYAGPKTWVIGHDGTDDNHLDAVIGATEWGHALKTVHQKLGPGPAWNATLEIALEHWEYLLWLEDDWELNYELDINPYVQLLQELSDVGTVRLSGLPTGLLCETVGHNGIHYLNILKTRQYAWSGNPSLNHRRHFEAYGGFPTDPSIVVGDCELYHDGRVRRVAGPAIWRPADLLAWGIFGHIGA